jgi:hypothetical protein
MPRREFDEVWDRDLMRQQLGEMRKESSRLKRELARAKKVQEQTWRETSELRRLVQDSHLREKHLRSRCQDLIKGSDGELSGEPAGAQRPAVQPSALVEPAGERPPERVDPSLVDRVAEEETSIDGWPTPESTLPTLAAHPGWGNYASMGEDGVVIGVSLLGLDHNARKDVIDLVSAQQLRNPQLFPIFVTDDDDFRALRAEHFVFEYLPPWPGEDVVPSRERWEAFLAGRLALIKKKWGVRRFVSFCSAGYDPIEGSGSDVETVQRELTDAAKD